MPKDKFTATEVMALQEQTLKEVRILGEGVRVLDEKLSDVKVKVDKIEEDVGELKQDMKVVKLTLTHTPGRINDHENRIGKLEKKIA
jgi:peptidoglycan hydrolase CwlO-like protein